MRRRACLAKTRTRLSPAPRSSMAATPPISRTPCALRGRSRHRSMPSGGVLPEPEGRARRRQQERQRAVLAAAELAAAPTANWSRRSTGDWARSRSRRRQDQGQGAGQGRRALGRRRAAGHARFDPRADADPRLPRARPFPRQSRSARARAAARTRTNSIRAPTASPTPTSTARSSSTRCSASNSRPARDHRDPARAPTARRSASSSCTSPIPRRRRWIQERIEGRDKEITFTREGKRAILNKLVEAEGFEKFCDLKFTGTKRFGLDGGESMIPALEQIIKRGGALGVKEIVFGMAHRGRLNVLAQVMGKPHRAIFHEFKGGSSTPDDVEGSGDVKYHLGASSDREFDGNKVHLSLTANPSHLEIVNPVVLGKVRAKQDQHGATREDRTMVMPLLISRRRGVRRPGRGRGMLRPVGPARPSHRRLGAFHRQQPDRLHHLSALLALLALSVRRRQDDRGADLPRQRRRSGGGGVRRQGRDRVPAEIPEAGRHRHVLLSPLRPQRGRRAGVHPAADVQGDPLASVDARHLRQAAGRRGRGHRRRSREDEGRLARAARRRARGEPGLQAQQGRLARRPLGRHEAGRRRATIRAAATPASRSRR